MEVKVLVCSSVDAGKTTLTAVLTYDVLDDGRGSARRRVLAHPHEQETGRTSSVTKTYMRKSDTEQDKNSYVSFIDLAGHEKYFRTTIHGMTGSSADYAMLVVGANMGVTKMVKEHLSIIVGLKIPVYVVVTKLDIAPVNILEETLKDIETLISKSGRYKLTTVIETMDQANQMIDLYSSGEFGMCPIFKVSNKTGENIKLLKSFVESLPSLSNKPTLRTNRNFFRVHDKFNVAGVGLVTSGEMIEGEIRRGDHLFMGPLLGKWYKMTVRSLHDNFKNPVDILQQGQGGCIAVKFNDKPPIKLNKNKIKKGVVIGDDEYKLTRRFEAQLVITRGHATTIKQGYQPMINCKTVAQVARIMDVMKQPPLLRGGEVSTVKFEFMHRAEFLNDGDIFVIREGNLRGMGKIVKLCD